MDVITHALVGAATGGMFGRPVIGAVVAAMPDIVLGLPRQLAPTKLYDFTHSVLAVLCAAALAWVLGSAALGFTVLCCLASHLVLDLPTHGVTWGPPLLYPFSSRRFSLGAEWEFFNQSWCRGLVLSGAWVFAAWILYRLIHR